MTLKFLFSAQFASQAFFKLVKETKRNKGGATLSISNEKNILMGSFNDAQLKVDALAKVCTKFTKDQITYIYTVAGVITACVSVKI